MKAYLAGEQKYRRGKYAEAIADFQEAVELDSTFARAMYRLGDAYGWLNEFSLSDEYGGRAAALADRLPEREATLISLAADRPGNVEALERFTRRYPDDADAWYLLGDGYWHRRGIRFDRPEKYQAAFETAIERAPHYREATIHLLDDAAARLDRERIADLVAIQAASDTSETHCPGIPILYDLRWGDEVARAAAAADADTLPIKSIDCLWTAMAASTETLERGEKAFLAGPPNYIGEWRAFGARLYNGQPAAALRLFAEVARRDSRRMAGIEASHNLMLHVSGYRDTAGLGRHINYLRSEAVLPAIGDKAVLRGEEEAHGGWVINHFWLGVLAWSEGRFTDVQAAIAAIDSTASIARPTSPAKADTTAAYGEALGEFARIMNGSQDDLAPFEAAVAKLSTRSPVAEFPANYLRFEIGKFLLERGETQKAERYLQSIYPFAWPYFVPAQYELGRLYEATGERDRAREHYRIFAEWWKNADPELQPRRAKALAALRRLAPDA
jgi:tetratricopeptide (TPR) repeat protein